MSTEANVVHLTAERFDALVRAAADQGKSPDELADEAIAALLRRRLRTADCGDAVGAPDFKPR